MIYVITHKKFNNEFINSSFYKILHVGTNDNYENYYLLDTTGDSISSKNESYCELTGIYWLWKNALSDNGNGIVGIDHYRRYFVSRMDFLKYLYLKTDLKVANEKCIRSALCSHDIILPPKKQIHMTVKEFYADAHFIEDLYAARKAIEIVSPDIISSFDTVMGERFLYYANMLICNQKVYSEYCEWLFEILRIVEEGNDCSKYVDAYQKRVYGFLSERLLQVWVKYKKYNIYEMPVINPEEERQTILVRVKNHFKRKREK